MVTRIMDKHKLTSEERQRVQAQIRKHLRVNVFCAKLKLFPWQTHLRRKRSMFLPPLLRRGKVSQ